MLAWSPATPLTTSMNMNRKGHKTNCLFVDFKVVHTIDIYRTDSSYDRKGTQL